VTPTINSILRAFLVVIGLATAGIGDAADGIVIRDAWSRATAPGTTVGAAYFVIDNRGPGDRLLRASSPIAERVELHISSMVGGVMKMQPLEAVELERQATVTFAPRGKHVMLIGLRQPLKAGDKFPLTLTFEKSGSISTTVQVRDLGQSPRGAH